MAGVEALIRAPLETRAHEFGESNEARVRLETGQNRLESGQIIAQPIEFLWRAVEQRMVLEE